MAAKKSSRWLSAVSAGLLFFVFFLPLHVHPAGGAPLAKDCACVNGQRAKLAAPAVAAVVVPPLQSFVPVVVQSDVWASECLTACSVRAPPVLLAA